MTQNVIGSDDVNFEGSRTAGPMSKVFGVSAGAEAKTFSPAKVNIKSIRGNADSSDLRVKIMVPPSYMTRLTSGYANALGNFQGIIFPYTPQISYDNRAEYSSAPIIHSNYSQQFYQRSSIGTISIVAKFTVQNDTDAINFLSTIHLLKSILKMRFGNDPLAGTPPPICRLSGYGKFVLHNVPIALTNYRTELPDTVDYYTLGKNEPDLYFGVASVPVISSLNISAVVMYSRNELLQMNVEDWLNSDYESTFKDKGFI